MGRAQPRAKVQQVSRTLVSPRQVWDVQHSRIATVHREKMAESGCGCTQCWTLLYLLSEVEDWQHRLVINTALGQDAQTEI